MSPLNDKIIILVHLAHTKAHVRALLLCKRTVTRHGAWMWCDCKLLNYGCIYCYIFRTSFRRPEVCASSSS